MDGLESFQSLIGETSQESQLQLSKFERTRLVTSRITQSVLMGVGNFASFFLRFSFRV